MGGTGRPDAGRFESGAALAILPEEALHGRQALPARAVQLVLAGRFLGVAGALGRGLVRVCSCRGLPSQLLP